MLIKLLEFFISILPLGLYGIYLFLNDKMIDSLVIICFTLLVAFAVLFFKEYKKID